MSDYAVTWNLSRGRFVEAVSGLSAEQLNWRLHPNALTIGEMAFHVAGVEASFVRQLLDVELEPDLLRLSKAATDGAVNDLPFPYEASEITPESVQHALKATRSLVEPVITEASRIVRDKQIVSALGPVIDGNGALARFAFHPGYHQGQVYLIRSAPGFPV